jgi:Tfp pilus assembly protein PilN
MKAINLIPPDERRGAGGAGGRAAGGAYVLLGALVALVAMVATYSLTVKTTNDRRSQLAQVQRDTQAAEAHAATLASYTDFKNMRIQRVETVKSIAASRFDWPHAMHELGRTLPANAVLDSLRGTIAAGITVPGTSVPLRGALPSLPAIELSGCVPGPGTLAHMLVNLRRIDGVRRVTLQQAQGSNAAKTASSASAASSAPGSVTPANCGTHFTAVVFYDAVKAITPPAAPGSPATPTAGTPAPTTTGVTR